MDPSDNPGRATTTDASGVSTLWYASSLGGDLGLTITDGVESLTLADLHGDVATTVVLPSSGTITGIGGFADFDEYGRALTAQPDTGGLTYGWLGGNERATDTTGLLLMGVRTPGRAHSEALVNLSRRTDGGQPAPRRRRGS